MARRRSLVFEGGYVKVHRSCAALLLTALAAGGCAVEAAEDTAKLDQWLGDNVHFAVSGNFHGKAINIRVEGESAKAAGVRCTRNYAPLPGSQPDAEGKYDTSQMYFIMKEIGVVVDFEGKPTDISVGYWGNDPAAGTSLEVIPRQQGTQIPAGKAWVDFELSEPNSSGPNGIEKAAEGGTLQMNLNSGTPDPGGIFIPPGGRTGEFLTVSWGPQESLTISATSECQSAEVVMWGQRIVLPK
jgi:hypothetical protein